MEFDLIGEWLYSRNLQNGFDVRFEETRKTNGLSLTGSKDVLHTLPGFLELLV
jgi:hypothetical protein